MSSEMKQEKKFRIVLAFTFLVACLLVVNFIAFTRYKSTGVHTVIPSDAKLLAVPLGSMVFILVGLVLLGISCFAFLQLRQYKTGMLFAVYVLLLGLSVSLAPCDLINNPGLSLIRAAFNYSSSILLFHIVGNMTLLTRKKLYKILAGVLIILAAFGLMSMVLALFPLKYGFVYRLSGAMQSGCIFYSADFCLFLMAIEYRKANIYSKTQMKILFFGIGVGALLFLIVSLLPDIMVVPNVPGEGEVFVEVTMDAANTVSESVPLLLFAGISAAILYVLLKREFSLDDPRLSVWKFVFYPVYIGAISCFLFFYGNVSVGILFIVLILLITPALYRFWKLFSSPGEIADRTYEMRLLAEVDQEKQELSVYLHDDVLQSLIAFYRKVRADDSGQYHEMEAALSELIDGVRRVSHNLYPTVVEDLGLQTSLEMCISELGTDYPEMSFSFDYRFQNGILPKELSLTIYRTARELMTNAAKHSGGRHASLLLEEDTAGYYLYVSDDGKGMSASSRQANAHIGLFTVRKQISLLGGSLDVEEKNGTHYRIYIPKEV